MRLVSQDWMCSVPFDVVSLEVEWVPESWCVIAKDGGHRRYCMGEYAEKETAKYVLYSAVNNSTHVGAFTFPDDETANKWRELVERTR